jgi:hypothetical protein
MRRYLAFLLVAAGTGLLTGCVEQRYIVTTDPPGAVVLRNGVPLGQSPVDDHFVYYGTYHFTILLDGYETLQVDQTLPTPWYDYFPLDFFSENVVPCKIRDVRRFHYKLEPRRMVNTNDLLNDAENLRNRGISIRPPDSNPPPGPPAPPPAPPGTGSTPPQGSIQQ